jgi:Skp family chaperone for outer membrane proteins
MELSRNRMLKVNTNQLGWFVAVAVIGVVAGSGFQGATDKMGVADLGKIAEQSDYYKQNEVTYNNLVARRRGVLEFFSTYKVLTTDQTNRIKELSLKDNPTPQEKAELDRLKGDVMAQDKRSKELAIKANSTPEERTLMEDFARRAATMNETLDRLSREFDAEVQQNRDKIQTTALEKARDAVREVGKAQGYTVILSANAAPYAANDLTDAGLKAMNAKH